MNTQPFSQTGQKASEKDLLRKIGSPRIIWSKKFFRHETQICRSFNQDFEKAFRLCLSYLTVKISNGFDSPLQTGIILIALQTFFIDHDIFLQKMLLLGSQSKKLIGLGHIVSCKYKNSWKFHVKNHDKFFSSADLSYGVPQGFILWPLLFLVHTNDMPQIVNCDLIL